MQTEVNNLQNVGEFYDDFSKKQVVTGTNLRHYYLFTKIVKSGLKRNHDVLEIGCGIGTLTSLLYSYLKNGKIVATDISSKNIQLAQERIKSAKRIEFFISDMQDFSYAGKFDFIVLADVLEHIPMHLHGSLFQTITKYMKDDATLFINIPHPSNIEFLRANAPEKLQIIDQALYADELTKVASACGLILSEFKSYSLYHSEDDYNIIRFRLNRKVNYTPKAKSKIIIKKNLYRLFYLFLKI
jgi:cyclopropane fatty-acyl-phospholipid synthase-like methyltransferase